MSYVVLARKWRPQTFGDVTGQEHVVRTLANAIAAGRVAHAYLFCGPRGVGKTTAARLLARSLNCVQGPTAEPCGTCAPCTEIAAGTSVDVQEIDGASNNSVEDVRQIRERVGYLPQRDKNKIYIIDEVHMLTGSAFNALLKTLEEPPPHVKFIFATTEPHRLPDTILSRCQRHNFRRIAEGAMVARLRRICEEEKVAVSERALSMVARQAEGGMRDALSLLEQIVSTWGEKPSDAEVAEALGTVDRTAIHALAQALVRRDPKTALAVVEEQYVRGVELKRLAEETALYLRHLIVAKVAGAPPEELADVEKKAVRDLAADADTAQLTRLFDIVHGSVAEVGRSVQPRTALEVALLKAIHLAPSVAVPDLIAKVDELARSLGAAPDAAEAAPGGRGAPSSFRAAPLAPPQPAPPVAAEEPDPAGGEVDRPSAPPPTARPLTVDSSPGGCATGECLEPEDSAQRWKKALDAIKAKRARVGLSLAHGRVLALADGTVKLGFAPEDGFHKAQVAKNRAEIEALMAALWGKTARLQVEDAAEAGGSLSPAQEAARAEQEREEKARRRAREQPAVVAAMRVLGGNVEEIRLHEAEEQGGETGEEAG